MCADAGYIHLWMDTHRMGCPRTKRTVYKRLTEQRDKLATFRARRTPGGIRPYQGLFVRRLAESVINDIGRV